MSPDLPPRVGLSVLKRAAIASLAIVLMAAGTVTASGLLLIKDEQDAYTRFRDGRPTITLPSIDRADAGQPRTIMILGSDRRHGDKQAGIKPRADTIILARFDPDKDAITLMSIPRDLKVKIPGRPYEDKINAAYEGGGAELTLKTVKRLLSFPGRPFDIHHVVQVDFRGFRRAVDYLGCVYVDIDRRYFNPVGGVYATIDVQPGYQKLCGQDSLDYVRYRHTDNDIVRAARQQDFLRQLKDSDAVRDRLKLNRRREILRLIARYADTDRGLTRTKTLISLLKLAIFTSDQPIQEVAFGAGRLQEEGLSYLTASRDAIKETVGNFLNARTIAAPKGRVRRTPAERTAQRKRRKRKLAAVPGLEVAGQEAEDAAIVAQGKARFPVYYPTLRMRGGGAPEARTYSIRTPDGSLKRAYRMVLKGPASVYYGVQGMTWKDPPILDGPHDEVERSGRKLRVYYDGRRVRLVAWRTKRGVYYVHNTLLRTLNRRQMLAIAESLKRVGAR